jgi:predicted Zn-dependent protease
LIRQFGIQWLESAHSREHEFEADALGGLLMRAAGFDPTGAIRLLERLRGLDQTSDHSGLGVYFHTHPAVEDRILNLRRRLTTKG